MKKMNGASGAGGLAGKSEPCPFVPEAEEETAERDLEEQWVKKNVQFGKKLEKKISSRINL